MLVLWFFSCDCDTIYYFLNNTKTPTYYNGNAYYYTIHNSYHAGLFHIAHFTLCYLITTINKLPVVVVPHHEKNNLTRGVLCHKKGKLLRDFASLLVAFYFFAFVLYYCIQVEHRYVVIYWISSRIT